MIYFPYLCTIVGLSDIQAVADNFQMLYLFLNRNYIYRYEATEIHLYFIRIGIPDVDSGRPSDRYFGW